MLFDKLNQNFLSVEKKSKRKKKEEEDEYYEPDNLDEGIVAI
jgi:hypothetical protein